MTEGSTVATLAELLLTRATRDGAATGYVYLDKTADGEEQRSLSYGDLYMRAARIAVALRERAKPGGRVLILMPPGLGFLEAFLGCMLAETVAVPTFPPDPARFDRTLARLHAIAVDCEPALVLCAPELLDLLAGNPELAGPLGSLPWMTPDAAEPCEPRAFECSARFASESTAMLQYTSGSTGRPRGVILTHRNLLANVAIINAAFGHNRDCRGVIWLPPYHDMGLIGGILSPLAAAFPVLLMSPLVMLQSPLRWLKAVSSFGGTTSGGPNFAYELAVRRTTPEQRAELDLSTWSVAFCGAEPIRKGTLSRFAEAFAPAGFRETAFLPCYGLAEATLMVTGQSRGQGYRSRAFDREALAHGNVADADESEGVEFISCGNAVGDWQVEIVNPDNRTPAAPSEVGELWVRGASVAAGYWRKPEQTEEIFRAYLASGSGPFLRTGDLGFVRDGCVYIAGRTKDLIIVRGRNLHAQDIERTVEACDRRIRAGCVAAFAVDDGGSEQLAILAEVGRKVDLEAIERSVRESVSVQHSAQVYALALIEPRSLPKTSSGKIARSACRQSYLKGELPILAEWRHAVASAEPAPVEVREVVRQVAAAEVLDWLRNRVAALVRGTASNVSVDRPVLELGLDSLGVASLVAEMSAWLGYEVPVAEALEHSSLARFAASVAERTSRGPAPSQPVALPTSRTSGEVAIVGMACRFPGAPDADATWEVLRNGRCTVDLPGNARRAVAPCTRPAGYLESIDRFDAAFFGMSPREVARTDPQHRLVLEVAWEALEDAGIRPQSLSGTATGVFVGISTTDYGPLGAEQAPDLHTLTGAAMSMVANRLSHFLDLRGPSLAVDTACSSSLAAVHLACQGLRTGDADVAMAAGVNILLSEATNEALSRAAMLSDDFRCKTFDARANGYVRGEGCGVVVLKRLEDAERDGDRILGTIRSSVMTHGGRSPGITVPRASTQEAMLRRALAAAGLTAADVGFVEAHGTGTHLGDPVELQALSRVLDGGGSEPCWVSSIKANLGHLESAAGIAGLIKVLLCMQRGEVPPQANFETPTGAFRFESSRLEVPRKLHPWPREKRVAAVSSFGFGGANAHVVVDGTRGGQVWSASKQGPHVLVLSARTASALDVLVDAVARSLEVGTATLAEAAHTAATGRQHFQHRIALVCSTELDAIAGLNAFLAGRPYPGLQLSTSLSDALRPTNLSSFDLRTAGSTAVSTRHPFYATRLDSLHAVLLAEGHGVLDPQAAEFAAYVALAELLVHLGVPGALLAGEQLGGLAAACVKAGQDAKRAVALFADAGTARLVAELGESAAAFEDGLNDVMPTVESRDACQAIAELLATQHVREVPVRWDRFYTGRKPPRSGLPTYPFERQSHWIEQPTAVPLPVRAESERVERQPPTPNVAAVSTPQARSPVVLDMVDALALVAGETAAVLQVDVGDIESSLPLVEQGMDSMLAIELQDRLEDTLGLRLPMDDLMKEATPSDVARLLVEALGGAEAKSA